MTAADHLDAVIVGGGPRGVATALRTAARVTSAGTSPVRLAIIDALAVGSGATWLIDQPAQYLNNTQADATTVHPDDSTPMTGPDAPGPSPVTAPPPPPPPLPPPLRLRPGRAAQQGTDATAPAGLFFRAARTGKSPRPMAAPGKRRERPLATIAPLPLRI